MSTCPADGRPCDKVPCPLSCCPENGVAIYTPPQPLRGIAVMNLFAFRATSPDDMKAAVDPIGPQTDRRLGVLLAGAREHGLPVLAARGAHGDHLGRASAVRAMAAQEGARLVCLGKTKGDHPRHPLYVPGDQPLVPY